MPIDSQLLRFVRHVAAEWRNGEDDWPEIEKALVGIIDADIEESKAIALLIGLRACDQQANNPHRLEALKLKQALLNRKKGYQAIQSARREKRALSLRSFERSASLIAYGFLLDRGKRAVPKAEFRALAPALGFIVVTPPTPNQVLWEQLYQNFRQRVRRLRAKEGDNIEEIALEHFQGVYATVFE